MTVIVAFALDELRAVLEAHEWTPDKADWRDDRISACSCGEGMSSTDPSTGKRKRSPRDYERWLGHIEVELVRRKL